MKYFALIFSLFLFGCGADETTSKNEPVPREDESKGYAALNFTDTQGLKQGHWIIYGKDDRARGYPEAGKIEEGNYKDGEKDGEWRFYKKNGNEVDSIAVYEQGSWIKTVSRDSVANEVE